LCLRIVKTFIARATENQQTLVNAPPLPEELARADSEVGLAAEQARTAKARLDKCTVKAPLSGTVLRTFLKARESVSTVFPQPIISLADTSQMRVRAEVDERDVGRVHLGQSVIVLADAYPDKKFAGRVSRVSAVMGRKKVRTGDPAEKSDRDVLEVFIDLHEKEGFLIVGLTCLAVVTGIASAGFISKPRSIKQINASDRNPLIIGVCAR
jgi:HlyD family secretion protein